MEKMGIYELFTVLGAGMLSCVLWYLALGLPYFEKLLSEDNLIIIVMGVLISYIIGIILQEISSLLDDKIFKFRKKARKKYLEDGNRIVKNREELNRFRKLGKEALNKDDIIFSKAEAENFFIISKTYLEREGDNARVSRLNSIYGMSRSLIISTFLMIPCTFFAGIWWKSLFEIMDSIAFKEIMVIVELGMVWIFYKRSKRFAKIKVRVIMRYYSHAIKSK